MGINSWQRNTQTEDSITKVLLKNVYSIQGLDKVIHRLGIQLQKGNLQKLGFQIQGFGKGQSQMWGGHILKRWQCHSFTTF